MQHKKSFYVLIWLISIFFSSQIFAQNHKIISSAITFKIKHAFGSTADGSFKGFLSTISFNPNDLENSKIIASIDSKSIDTGLGMRDKEMRNEEYLDVAKYPKITMVSTKFEKTTKPNEFIGYFNLTIKKTSKNFKIPIIFTQNGNQMSFRSNFSVNRIEFGVGEKSSLLGDIANLSILVSTQQL